MYAVLIMNFYIFTYLIKVERKKNVLNFISIEDKILLVLDLFTVISTYKLLYFTSK